MTHFLNPKNWHDGKHKSCIDASKRETFHSVHSRAATPQRHCQQKSLMEIIDDEFHCWLLSPHIFFQWSEAFHCCRISASVRFKCQKRSKHNERDRFRFRRTVGGSSKHCCVLLCTRSSAVATQDAKDRFVVTLHTKLCSRHFGQGVYWSNCSGLVASNFKQLLLPLLTPPFLTREVSTVSFLLFFFRLTYFSLDTAGSRMTCKVCKAVLPFFSFYIFC